MKFLIWFLVVVASAAAVQDLSGKMFVFPQKSDTAHVRLSPAQENFTAFTVCHRSFSELKRPYTLFSLATPTGTELLLTLVNHNSAPLFVSVSGHVAKFAEIDFAPNKWHSVCVTWSSASGLVQAWLDDQPLAMKYITEAVINGKPSVTLGQYQLQYGGPFYPEYSFEGMMTDVHLWDTVLSSCEIHKYMKEQSFTPGNVLNWAALDFEIRDRVLIENKQIAWSCN